MATEPVVFHTRARVWTLLAGLFMSLVLAVAALGKRDPLLGFFALITLVVTFRIARARISMSHDAVAVRNIFGSRLIPWSEIERFELGRFLLLPLTVIIVLRDGSSYHASAIAPKPTVRRQVEEAEHIIGLLNAGLPQPETP